MSWKLDKVPLKSTHQISVCLLIVFLTESESSITSPQFKSELPSRVSDSSFSLLHNNIRSFKRNLENFQVHLLDEFNFEFSIIGVSETKIISGKEMDFNTRIPGYVFEYVPTPLASGGVGLYINDSLKYTVIEKVCDEAFQSLSKSNFRRKATSFVITQHNSPKLSCCKNESFV